MLSNLSKSLILNSIKNKRLLNQRCLFSTIFLSNKIVISNKKQNYWLNTQISSYVTSSNSGQSPQSTTVINSDSKSSEQTSDSSELIIEHLNEGIVEVQLNRVQGKNALSKKLLFEVRKYTLN